MGTRPDSLSSAVTWGDRRRGGSGRRGLAGSAGPAAFISLGLPPPSSPLFSPPPWGLGGDGAGRWQSGGWRGQYGACDKSGCCLDKWGTRSQKSEESEESGLPRQGCQIPVTALPARSSTNAFPWLRSLSFLIQHQVPPYGSSHSASTQGQRKPDFPSFTTIPRWLSYEAPTYLRILGPQRPSPIGEAIIPSWETGFFSEASGLAALHSAPSPRAPPAQVRAPQRKTDSRCWLSFWSHAAEIERGN